MHTFRTEGADAKQKALEKTESLADCLRLNGCVTAYPKGRPVTKQIKAEGPTRELIRSVFASLPECELYRCSFVVTVEEHTD